MDTRPPVIIIGMSHSATGIPTKLLGQLGLFVGLTKESKLRKSPIEIKYEDLLGEPVRVSKTPQILVN